jgi:transposase
MKKKENIETNTPKVRIKESLSKYDTMPLFQKKVDKANATLAKYPPFEAIKTVENDRIKAYFQEGKNLEQIAVLMRLSEEEIGLRFKELSLLEKIGG